MDLVELEVRENVELAKVEMAEKARTAGTGVAFLTAAAVAGLLALGALSAFLILALDGVMPNWAAALCVAAIWVVAGGVLAVYGRRKIDEIGTAVPSRTIEAVKEDVEWLQTSDELKQEISQTREQMAETADALAYKADVPTRTKDWVGDKKDAIVSAVGGATSAVGEATPDGADVAQSAGPTEASCGAKPCWPLAIGGAAVGFIAGLLAPSTRIEDERIGPTADEVKATATEAGREALDSGKDVVQEAGSTAIETAKEPSGSRGRG